MRYDLMHRSDPRSSATAEGIFPGLAPAGGRARRALLDLLQRAASQLRARARHYYRR